MRNGRVLQNTVAEVENMRPTTKGFQHLIHTLVERFSPGDKHERIEIALQRLTRTDTTSRDVERNPPVDTHDVGACLPHRAEKFTGTEIAREVAPWRGQCPVGHEHYRYRKPTRPLSCGVCSRSFTAANLITWMHV